MEGCMGTREGSIWRAAWGRGRDRYGGPAEGNLEGWGRGYKMCTSDMFAHVAIGYCASHHNKQLEQIKQCCVDQTLIVD